MKVTNLILISAIVVIAGKWARNESLDLRIGVGAFFTIMVFSALSEYNVPLATDLAMLILVSSVIINGPSLFTAIKKVTG